jgi:PHD/YefM family antitoxin component YafN of YafNO toxin-antitoxin module
MVLLSRVRYTVYLVYLAYAVRMNMTTMGTREMRDNIGPRIDAAHFKGEPTVIEKNGEPRAVLVSYAWWRERQDASEDQ